MSRLICGLFSKLALVFSGNPKRYHSHEVVRMETERRSGSRPIDGPVEEIETAGQKHLQALLQKQLNTKISLQQ